MVSAAVSALPLVVVCGPTAVGKSAAAMALAQQIGGEIVAADSRTLYRGMDIGTAKPTPAQRSHIPHHLIDVADPADTVTLAGYRRLALAAVAEIQGRGRIALLVGGTGLYIRAVVDGFQIPAVPPDADLRARLEDAERRVPGSLHARLAKVDPLAAARIHPRNVHRLIRALEVHAHTGRAISTLQRRANALGRVVQVGLTMERAALYRRIDERVDGQIASGLVDEVRRLLAAGNPRTLPSLQGLGYKEIIEWIDGRVPYEEAVRRLRRNTRRFAKRQYTWFRRDPRIRWIDVDALPAEAVAGRIRAVVE